jgi:hypothetical protein
MVLNAEALLQPAIIPHSSNEVADLIRVYYAHQQLCFSGVEMLSQGGSVQQNMISKKPLHFGVFLRFTSTSQKLRVSLGCLRQMST